MIEIQIDNLFVVQNQIERLSRGISGDNRYLLMRRLAGTMRYAVAQNFKQGGRPEWLAFEVSQRHSAERHGRAAAKHRRAVG